MLIYFCQTQNPPRSSASTPPRALTSWSTSTSTRPSHPSHSSAQSCTVRLPFSLPHRPLISFPFPRKESKYKTTEANHTAPSRDPTRPDPHQGRRRHHHDPHSRHHSPDRVVRTARSSTAQRPPPLRLHAVRAARGLRRHEVLEAWRADGPQQAHEVRLRGVREGGEARACGCQ
jgi:hypothetical protein